MAFVHLGLHLGILIAFKLSSPQVVRVPNLHGLTQNQATTKLSKENLGVGKITKVADDKTGYNKVVKTYLRMVKLFKKELRSTW